LDDHSFESFEMGDYSPEDLEWLDQISPVTEEETQESINPGVLPVEPESFGIRERKKYSSEDRKKAIAAYYHEQREGSKLGITAFAKQRDISPRNIYGSKKDLGFENVRLTMRDKKW